MATGPAGWLAQLAARLEEEVPPDADALPDALEPLLLGARRRYTRAQIAERAGLAEDEGRRLWRALGFPDVADDEVAFTDRDLEALGLLAQLTDAGVLKREVREAVIRAIAQSVAGLAWWQVRMLAQVVEDVPEAERARRSLELAASTLPVLEQLQTFMWRRHLAATVRRLLTVEALSDGAAERAWLTIGFADMVGFTKATRSRSIDELGDVLERFFAVSAEVVAEGRGRIVKTIGDEVMYVADTAADAAAIALELQDRVQPEPALPELRIGLAAGPVLVRFGDVYGEPVNIAARLTARTRPGRVLVDREVAAALADDPAFSLRPLRPLKVRGYEHLARWRLTRGRNGQ